MATASSPALANNSPGPSTATVTVTVTTPAAANSVSFSSSTGSGAGAGVGVGSPPTINASKNLRGLNKPRCIKCHNVARSRCPYQSCKSCCAKANNPCHIHVLKGGSTFPDKVPSTSSPFVEQKSTEASSSGNPGRVTSIRQLSQSFAQFNNLPSPLRSKKPLTRKDAALMNEWRFLKLKEYKDSDIEAENEAFDRYMQNVNLLEEVFSVNSTQEEATEKGASVAKPDSISMDDDMKTAELKSYLRSSPVRTENIRKRMQYIVDKGLRNLSMCESDIVGTSDYREQDELDKTPKKLKSWWAERASSLSYLVDKLNKARNEEDLNTCLEMKAQLFSKQTKTNEDAETSRLHSVENDSSSVQQSDNSLPKCFRTTTVDQDVLARIDAQFLSLEEIEDL